MPPKNTAGANEQTHSGYGNLSPQRKSKKAWTPPQIVIIRFVDTAGGAVGGLPENSSGSISS